MFCWGACDGYGGHSAQTVCGKCGHSESRVEGGGAPRRWPGLPRAGTVTCDSGFKEKQQKELGQPDLEQMSDVNGPV